MRSGFAGDIVPAFDRLDRRRLFERSQEDLAIHVFAGWQAKQCQNGRADVQQTGAEKPLIGAQCRSFEANNAKVSMLDRRPCGFGRNVAGP